MNNRTKFKLSVALLLALCATPLGAQGYGTETDSPMLNNSKPADLESVTVEQRLGERLPLDAAFKDELGRPRRLGSFISGKRPVIVTLNYSDCPMLCSVQLNQLVAGLGDLELKPGVDFEIVTISINPRETPAAASETKRKYLQLLDKPGMSTSWHFLTGDARSISRVADALGFRYHYDRQTQEYFHPAMLAFVSPEGRISRYLLTFPYDADQLRLSLLDAGRGTIGSPVDQVILWCAQYDAERGRYVTSAWRLMKLGGGVTVLALLGLLTPFWFGRRNRTSAAASSAAEDPPPAGDSGTNEENNL